MDEICIIFHEEDGCEDIWDLTDTLEQAMDAVAEARPTADEGYRIEHCTRKPSASWRRQVYVLDKGMWEHTF